MATQLRGFGDGWARVFAGITTGENEVEQGMLEQKFLDRFDMERRIQSRLYCFGSGSSDSDSGGSDVSDEDLDEDLQQDIAAAAVFKIRAVGRWQL